MSSENLGRGMIIGLALCFVFVFLHAFLKIAVLITGASYLVFTAIKTRKQHPESTSLLVLMTMACFVLALDIAFKDYVMSQQPGNRMYFWTDKIMLALCFTLAAGAIWKSVYGKQLIIKKKVR